MKRRLVLLGACIAALASSISAQSNILQVKPDETVYDREGGTVGTVIAIDAETATVNTGTMKVTLGFDSFRRSNGKLTLPMNRAALETAAGKVQAAGDDEILPLLRPGAPFYDSQGQAVGTVVSVEGKQVTVEAGTLKATLPVSAFVKGTKGPAIRSTAADFMAKLEAQRPNVAPAPDSKQPR